MWRRILAIPVLLLGIGILAGVAYTVYQRTQSESQGTRIGGVAFGIGLIYVGVKWLRGNVAE